MASSSLPYPINSLTQPLDHTKRANLIHYLNHAGYTDQAIAKYIGWPTNVSLNQYINSGGGTAVPELDTLLIGAYNSVAAGGGFEGSPKTKIQGPSIPGVSSVVDFLKLLANPNTWLRVAEVLLGMLLVGAGLAKISQKAAVVIRQVPLAGKAIA